MIKLQELIGLPSLQYHIDNELTLHSNVYRYNSDAFINLFKEAREAHRDGKIQLNEEDIKLLETTDIGEYGDYNGIRVPLDLPMVSPKYNPLFEIGCMIDEMIEEESSLMQDPIYPGKETIIAVGIDSSSEAALGPAGVAKMISTIVPCVPFMRP